MTFTSTESPDPFATRNLRVLVTPLLAAAFAAMALVGAGVVGYMILGLPDISRIRTYRPATVTEILDANGTPIDYIYREKRWPVPRARIPETLVHAFLAAEDARFYEHPGVDFWSVIRAAIKNLQAGEIVQGASTITQQVTRSLLLTPEKKLIRKIKEAILAWQIDAALTKDQILTLYLNQIYLGEGAYGVEAAARTYFGKHVEELNLAECAILAGLPQAPSRYAPTRHLDRALRRQAYVLNRMVAEGYITPEEAAAARAYPVEIKPEELVQPPGSEYFLAEVRRRLEARYGPDRVQTEGLRVVTTLDPRWQAAAYEEVEKGLAAVRKRHPEDPGLETALEGALVAMDARDGAVIAMVGGRDFSASQFNLAVQARRQPGSAFKPIVYATALAHKVITPGTLLVEEPITLPGATIETPWEPENYDQTYMGPITIRTALTYSRNIISVKVAGLVGVNAIRAQAKRMGITVPLANDLSLALGSSAVPLIQMVQAYSTFPNLGETVTPRLIREVRSRTGEVLEEMVPEKAKALDPVTSYQMVHLLEGVVQDGTGRRARALRRHVGGKTGTTDNFRDAWFLGFTPRFVAGVWVGRTDGKPIAKRETGGRVACPIWTAFMQRALEGANATDFPVPEGVAFVPENRKTGEIVVPDRDGVVWEAMPVDALPPLRPPAWDGLHLPSWLKPGGFPWFRKKPSESFEEYR
ncbi:PBP1A family penicillin-binding protein [Dissulfurirhabdus thermomarina]|uniref:peptidoglycan glycosyltransferase n=1 Tax=Dissulfurirhabdus thermomarina TaxID=1765737 RepID=A0A6N9TU19_DISTH|nr:PBP1A family penicillin-binding protein [Dissulfurirhabdus thermomarina]NDY43234.1 PBP1A family penicillin-binding protein [Dissulfurirhabdus thermomarina]NMX23024.1 PBP1A family penicillin-binding protein [Dissulfurirhabdus thermomarina]